MQTRLGFIGLGIMGAPMAGNLLAAGNPLVVHTRTRAKAQPLLDRGATWADSPADVARQAQVIFVCVTDTPDVQAVVAGPDGILSTAHTGTIVVDHSTISPSATRDLAAKLAGASVLMLDAPVSGGDIGARSATLAIMVGGGAGAFETVRPYLAQMGKSITHCGPSGAGQLTKLVNQVLVSITNLAVCEALTFAQKSGLDLNTTIAAVAGGAAGSWQLSNLGPRMAKRDFAPGFMVDLQAKDLRLVAQAAEEAGLELSAVNLVHELFAQGQREGRGREGTQSLIAMVEKAAQRRA